MWVMDRWNCWLVLLVVVLFEVGLIIVVIRLVRFCSFLLVMWLVVIVVVLVLIIVWVVVRLKVEIFGNVFGVCDGWVFI